MKNKLVIIGTPLLVLGVAWLTAFSLAYNASPEVVVVPEPVEVVVPPVVVVLDPEVNIQDSTGILYADNSMYEGNLQDGKPKGQGTYTWADGSKFVGEVKNGRRYNGVYFNTSGVAERKVIDGIWKYASVAVLKSVAAPVHHKKNPVPIFEEVYTHNLLNGTVFSGTTKNDNPWYGELYNKDNELIGSYVNGVWIKKWSSVEN